MDASALLCLLNDEVGADRVEGILDEAFMSAGNFSEVVAKIVERGGTAAGAASMLDPLHIEVVDFDRSQAFEAGELRAATRAAGLSFGDRACLAMALSHRLTVLTADRLDVSRARLAHRASAAMASLMVVRARFPASKRAGVPRQPLAPIVLRLLPRLITLRYRRPSHDPGDRHRCE